MRAIIGQKPMLFRVIVFATLPLYQSKRRSLSRVLHCDKTLRAFENAREMQKTRATGSAVACNRPTEALASVISFTFVVYSHEPLPGVLGNTGTVAFIFREQGIFSNYFQGTGELLTRLLGSFLGTRGFSNGEQGIKSKKVKGSWEHAPPPGRGSVIINTLNT